MVPGELIVRRITQLRFSPPRRRTGETQTLARRVLDPWIVEVDRIVGVADRRPDRPAVLLDLVQDHFVFVIGDREESSELRLWIVDEHGKKHLPLVVGDDGAIVGDELGKEGDNEQRKKDAQAPTAPPVCLEVAPATAIEGRKLEELRPPVVCKPRTRGPAPDSRCLLDAGVHPHTSRVSKSMRGSTSV